MSSYEQLSGEEPEAEFSVKLLYKETRHIAAPLTSRSTVLQLKNIAERLTSVPVIQQRLIFAGKALTPDSSTLSSFKIENNASVHLFPTPIATLASTIPQVNSNSGPIQALNVTQMLSIPIPFQQQGSLILNDNLIHNPLVHETSEPVKMWSFILVFSSGLTLFNYIMNLVKLGVVGSSPFDTVVNTFDAALSVAGIYVGQLGLNVIENIDFDKLERYVKLLIAVGIGCIILRCFWVVDLVFQAETMIAENKAHPKPDNPLAPALTEADMDAFTLQVRCPF